MKKLTYLAASAVLAVSLLSSCGGNKNANNDKNAPATEQTATQEDAAAKAAAEKAAAEEKALAGATEFFGWIKSIDGKNVTIANADGQEITVTIPNAGDELIEGSPITIKYIEVDGAKKSATDNEKSVKLSQNFKKLLGKWGTGKDNAEITFELRKSGKCKNVGKGQNAQFKSWRLKDDQTIEFEVEANGKSFFMPWTVDGLADDEMNLVNGESKLAMKRIDSNRE
ncbi:MAG: hypothetical protein II956_02530 [Bacteroidales bacterium]|nr:hypothetical protein [Bacteroidales bacterium]